ELDGRKVEQPDHPVAQMYRYGVTDQMIWSDWLEHTITSVLMQGNSLSLILRDERHQLIGLQWVPWGAVSNIRQLRSGRIAYDVADPINGQVKTYLQDQVLHIRDRSDNGFVGKSVLERAAESVATVQNTNNLAASTLRNGAFPTGILSAPGSIDPTTAARLKAAWEGGYSGLNAGKIAVAGDGLEFKPLSLTPESVELLESRKFGIQDIARLFHVPLIFVGDFSSSTFTNATTMIQMFASFALGQWAVKIQQSFAQAVLSRQHEIKLDLSDFQRGDPTQRWSSYDVASRNRILVPNEIREIEGFNPLPDGDKFPELAPKAQPVQDVAPSIPL
ncbi:MAG: phage portal protein, partial [Alphaproteobacteria bacterium]|nr:phage portal protein [Alphaproteobacteria bacterium]